MPKIDLDELKIFLKKALDAIDVLNELVAGPSMNGHHEVRLAKAQALLVAATELPVRDWRKERETSPQTRRPKTHKCHWCGHMFAAVGIGPHERYCRARPQGADSPRVSKVQNEILSAISAFAGKSDGFRMMDLRALLPKTISPYKIGNVITEMIDAKAIIRHGTGSGTIYRVK